MTISAEDLRRIVELSCLSLFSQQMELLDTILHELDQQLNSIPKSDLIAQEPNMSRMLQVGL